MNQDLRRLLRWMVRAQPTPAALTRALVAGVVATMTNVGLFVGAIALLVVSATRPGLGAVAGVLVVIELLAFLRSPLRYGERVTAHRLGFDAVTRWRRWLVNAVGAWDFTRWRQYAAGDLLERSLHDTDELQDLWLRAVVPFVATALTLLIGDGVVLLLPPHGAWWPYAGAAALLQLAAGVAFVANLGPLARVDRSLRRARSDFQSTIVELGAAAPEIALLGEATFIDQRSYASREVLRATERARHRRLRFVAAAPPLFTLAQFALLFVLRPATSPTWLVVVSLLALGSFESLNVVRAALDTAVAVSAASERLEDLESPASGATHSWPTNTTVRVEHLSLRESSNLLLIDVSFQVAPGRRVAITGSSGAGKSALLRQLAALDAVQAGSIVIGTTPLHAIREAQVRQHLAYVPSEPGLTRGFAVDVLRLGRASERDSFSDLAALGISADVSTRWGELSRGERSRVALARALVTNPSIYVLDEPTSGLGSHESAAMLELLADTKATMLVATHDPLVVAWCDEVMELRDGTLRVLNR